MSVAQQVGAVCVCVCGVGGGGAAGLNLRIQALQLDSLESNTQDI